MLDLKNIVALVVAAHGVGFTMWFLAAWVPGVEVTAGAPHRIFSGDVGITDPIGRVSGLVALIVMVGFLAVAWGIFTGATWWSGLAVATSVISLIAIVVPWWSVVPPLSAVGALVVDLGIIAFAVVPRWHDALSATMTA